MRPRRRMRMRDGVEQRGLPRIRQAHDADIQRHRLNANRLDAYAFTVYYVLMVKRTTIEIDQDLLERAKNALGQATTRGAVEEALRRATAGAEAEFQRRAAAQRHYLETMGEHLDLKVLASEEMWR